MFVLIPAHLLFAEAVHILLQFAYLNVHLNSESHTCILCIQVILNAMRQWQFPLSLLAMNTVGKA